MQQKDKQLKTLIKTRTKTAPFEIYKLDDIFIVERNKIAEFKSQHRYRCLNYIQLQLLQLKIFKKTRFPILEF